MLTVDASAAGEGQLEISINEGEVPNHVQVVGGGRCLGICLYLHYNVKTLRKIFIERIYISSLIYTGASKITLH